MNFQVKRLLGKDKGGYSFLASDGVQDYVIKQIHHEPCAYYQFDNMLDSEMRDYKRLKETGIPMSALLAVDFEQERILKEYIASETVFELVLNGKMGFRKFGTGLLVSNSRISGVRQGASLITKR